MEISARVLADSLSPCGARLTTYELTYPLIIHNELMTHRLCSRNTASSRAIPPEKLISRILENPFTPLYIGANQKGMQAGEELSPEALERVRDIWEDARVSAVDCAQGLLAEGAHKQVVNRLLNPFMYTTAVFSATSWDNWDGLRDHPDAEPHFQDLARKMKVARAASTPRELRAGEWHLPLVSEEDWKRARLMEQSPHPYPDSAMSFQERHRLSSILIKVSVGRCARVSYLTHDGKRDLQADIDLHDRLVVQQPAHASPAEHVAQALDWPYWFGSESATTVYTLRDRVVEARRKRLFTQNAPTDVERYDETALGELTSGNYLGFRQYRKTLENEHIGGLMP